MAHLPTPGSDEGIWGQLLNDYLSVSHDDHGFIKSDAVPTAALQDNSVSSSKLANNSVTSAKLATPSSPSMNQVLSYNGSTLVWTSAGAGSDPTMGGDLSGTASNAQIVANAVGATELATNAVITAKIADANVTDAKIATGVSQNKITGLVSDLAGKEPAISTGTTSQYYRGDKTFQTLDKTAVGLANVDNTADSAKPVSAATQTALNAKAANSTTITAGTGLTGGGDLSTNRTLAVSYGVAAGTAAQGNDTRITGAEQTVNKGVANGYAGLNSSTHVPTGQLGSGTADTTTYLRGDGTWTTTPTAPVTSVAGKTGVVTLAEGDVANLTTDLAGRTTVANGGGETFFDAGNSGTALTLSLANGNVQKITLTGNCTITLTNPASGAYRSIMLYVFQDGTGSRTVTWPPSVKWGTAGAPTLSTGATKMDKILLDTVDGGTTWYGVAGPSGY